MNKYEVVYIIDPAVEDEARKALIAKFNDLLGGVTVTMQEEGNPEAEVFKTETDEFGDFWFRQVEGKKYHLWFEAEDQGFVTREIAEVDATTADANIGRVTMYKMIPLG